MAGSGFAKAAVALAVLAAGGATGAHAAGGGGSAGGGGAQNQPASGRPPGQAGPAGSPNNPHGEQAGGAATDPAPTIPTTSGIRH